MDRIGLLCNCSQKTSPKDKLSPSLVNRAFLIDRLLEGSGIKLFLYSPRDVLPAEEVEGYTIHGDEMVADRSPVPKVNANWTYGTRRLINKGMGYRRFKRWAEENGLHVYVPYVFSELVSNKRKAYESVRAHHETLHPHTEDFNGSLAQLRSFLDRSELVFLKPRAGNRGNEIFVLRPEGNAFSLKYYEHGTQRSFSPITLEAALGVVEVSAGEKTYVIQEGVDSLRCDGAVFDVRVVMVHDGTAWHSLLESRVAPPESDLSNVFQGGSIRATEAMLADMLGEDAAREVEREIRSLSHSTAEHLEKPYPGELMEIGFDFVLDARLRPHLVEVNAKPGVSGFGSELKLFEWRPEDDAYYQQGVIPHVRHLASFLRTRHESAISGR